MPEREKCPIQTLSITLRNTQKWYKEAKRKTDIQIKMETFNAQNEIIGTNSGTGTSHTFTHNLGTRNVIVQLYDSSTYETVFAKVVRTSTSVVTVTTASSLSAGEITALITVID